MVAPRTDGPRQGRPPGAPAGADEPQTAAEARAAVEARRDEVRAERDAAFRAAYGDDVPGRWVLAASWVLTAAFAVAAILGVLAFDSSDVAFVVVSLALFLVGTLLFGLDLVLAAARSREAAMGIGGLFFLSGSAPPRVQRHLLGSFAVQVVVAIGAAAFGFARIDRDQLNSLAFGILVPVLGLASCGYWAVRWGVFPDRGVPAGPGGPTGPGARTDRGSDR